MNANKICPMRCIPGSSDPAVMPECLENRCAWWNNSAGACAIAAGSAALLSIGNSLKEISDTLEEIADQEDEL